MKLAYKIVQKIALCLGLEEDCFKEKFEKPMATLRLVHYTNEISDEKTEAVSCGAHTDYGMITILKTDEVININIIIIFKKFVCC